jgi:hypothetical protein
LFLAVVELHSESRFMVDHGLPQAGGHHMR